MLPGAAQRIERLWARDQSRRLAAGRKTEAAIKLPAEHQVVTPLTGAVVLETMQQYAQHGLKPAEPSTVPAVPEPQTWMLIGLGVAAFALSRARKKQAAKH